MAAEPTKTDAPASVDAAETKKPEVPTAPPEPQPPAWLRGVLGMDEDTPAAQAPPQRQVQQAPAPAPTPAEPDFSQTTLDPASVQAIRQMVQQELRGGLGPVVDALQATRQTIYQRSAADAHREAQRTLGHMQRVWKEQIATDPDYRSNPEIRAQVDGSLGRLVTTAVRNAMNTGDMSLLDTLREFQPLARVALAAAKAMLPVDEVGGGSPIEIRGGEMAPPGTGAPRRKASPNFSKAEKEAMTKFGLSEEEVMEARKYGSQEEPEEE